MGSVGVGAVCARVTGLLEILSVVVLVLVDVTVAFSDNVFICPSLSGALFFSVLMSLLALVATFCTVRGADCRGMSVCDYVIFF